MHKEHIELFEAQDWNEKTGPSEVSAVCEVATKVEFAETHPRTFYRAELAVGGCSDNLTAEQQQVLEVFFAEVNKQLCRQGTQIRRDFQALCLREGIPVLPQGNGSLTEDDLKL